MKTYTDRDLYIRFTVFFLVFFCGVTAFSAPVLYLSHFLITHLPASYLYVYLASASLVLAAFFTLRYAQVYARPLILSILKLDQLMKYQKYSKYIVFLPSFLTMGALIVALTLFSFDKPAGISLIDLAPYLFAGMFGLSVGLLCTSFVFSKAYLALTRQR